MIINFAFSGNTQKIHIQGITTLLIFRFPENHDDNKMCLIKLYEQTEKMELYLSSDKVNANYLSWNFNLVPFMTLCIYFCITFFLSATQSEKCVILHIMICSRALLNALEM